MIITVPLVISFIVTFVLVWLFVKTIGNKKWLSFLIAIVITPFAYFYLLYPMVNIFSSYHHEKYFNTEDWEDYPAQRFEMMSDILNDTTFIGETKAEIKSKLGKAEWYGWDDAIKANSKDKWNYNLGFKPGAFTKDQECLEFVFKNDTLKSIRNYQLEKKFE